jgi:hypothetical protein
VPTGCSTQRMEERLVQLCSFTVGLACPKDQLKGLIFQSDGSRNQAEEMVTPFSCSRPSSEEQPGPPFVLRITHRIIGESYRLHLITYQKIKSSRLPSGPGGKNQKKSCRPCNQQIKCIIHMTHLPRLVRTVADGQQTCPAWTNIKVDQRE